MGDSSKKYDEEFGENENRWSTTSTSAPNFSKSQLDFDITFPTISKEFKNIQKEQLDLFSKKMMDYGLGNIALGGNLENEDDVNYALQGIQIRINDKINRLKNLLKNGKNYVENESIEDTLIDISNYGIIGLLLGRKKWK
tara:strand:+ start:556 stop:975 length:420 start_codon:yes stop_codon:yes gene_type:complete